MSVRIALCIFYLNSSSSVFVFLTTFFDYLFGKCFILSLTLCWEESLNWNLKKIYLSGRWVAITHIECCVCSFVCVCMNEWMIFFCLCVSYIVYIYIIRNVFNFFCFVFFLHQFSWIYWNCKFECPYNICK